MKFNVRCCCTPMKILGTLELPDGTMTLRDGTRVPVTLPEKVDAEAGQLYAVVPELPKMVRVEHVLLRTFAEYDPDLRDYTRELAVYSEDRPVEYWRQFPTFEENK